MHSKKMLRELGIQNTLFPSQITGRAIGKFTSPHSHQKSKPSHQLPAKACKRFHVFWRSGRWKDHHPQFSQKYLSPA